MRSLLNTLRSQYRLPLIAVAFAVGLSAGHAPWLHASEDGVRQLLSMENRPTIADMKRHLSPWPRKNPFKGRDNYGRIARFSDDFPTVIVNFERAFPGATFAGLGRDSALIGDLLDAFYRSIGQVGRVVRLNASGGSFHGASQGTLVSFMKSAGLDLENIGEAPPFIIFDQTSYSRWYNQMSQSRALVYAGYQTYARMGGDPKDLVRKFNLISNGNYSANDIKHTNVEAFLSSLENRVGASGPDAVLLNPARLYGYSSEWHGSFGAFSDTGSGPVARVGPANSESVRQAILWELFEAIRILERPSFLKKVKSVSKGFGFEFPLKREWLIQDVRLLPGGELEYLRKDFARRTGDYKKMSGSVSSMELSPNGEDVRRWWRHHYRIHYAVEYSLLTVQLSANLIRYGKITEFDLASLLAEVLGRVKVEEQERFDAGMVDLLSRFKNLREVWDGGSEFLADPAATGSERTSARYQAISAMRATGKCGKYLEK